MRCRVHSLYKKQDLWYHLKDTYTDINWQDYCGSDSSKMLTRRQLGESTWMGMLVCAPRKRFISF